MPANETKSAEKASLIPPEISTIGKTRLDELVAAQRQQLDRLREMSQSWFDRLQSEAALASELAAKLTAVHSVPELATAYQEWAIKHVEMAAQDTKRIFSDAQKLAESGTQFFSKSFHTNGHAGSS